MGKSENSGFFFSKKKTIAACDLKVGRCRQLIEFMKNLSIKVKVISKPCPRLFMYEN